MPIDNLSKITSRSGINTTILLEAGNANVTGIVTAAGFDGPFTGGSDIAAGIITGTGLKISGISTFTGAVFINRTSALGNAKLSITKDSNQEGIGVQLNVSSGITTSLMAYNSSGSQIFDLAHDTDSTPDLIFKLKNSGDSFPVEKLRITSAGKVGIGTNNPQKKLEVFDGDIYLNSTDKKIFLSNDYDQYITANAASNYVVLGAGNKERVRIRSDNYIGIGTDVISKYVTIKAVHPFVRLEASDTSDKRLDFQVSSAGIATISAEQSSQQLSFKTTGGEALRIDSDGKVGIGTDDPTGKLEINTASSTEMITLNVSNANFARIGHNSASGTAVLDVRSEGYIRLLTGGNNERLRISGTNGSIGIGTDELQTHSTFYHTLNVAGDLTSQGSVVKIKQIKNALSNDTYTLFVDSSVHTSNVASAGPFGVNTYYGRAFTINGFGRVGIQTTRPDMALHVRSDSDDVVRFQSTSAGNGTAITLDHIGGSAADGDIVGKIVFNGQDDAYNSTTYADIRCISSDVSNGAETAHLDFGTRGLNAFNPILRLNARSTASAPSYTADDMNGIIIDTYNTGNPYPRYMNFIAKSGGDTDSNIGFWTESVGGSPTEKLRITSDGLVKWDGHTLAERNAATGVAGGLIYNSEGKIFQYHDGSGWISLNTTNQIVATGGNSVATSNGYRIHTFTGGGTFVITSGVGEVEVLVVAGGGSEGGGNSGCHAGGGGGGGGVVYKKMNLSAGNYPISIGQGGAWRNNGGNTIFGNGTDDMITAVGGGAGGPTLTGNGNDGGSGGGSSRHTTTNVGGNAQQPGTTDGGFGNAGGDTGDNTSPGGGGGAGSAGLDGDAGNQGRGGQGKQFTQFGVTTYFGAGGNAGGSHNSEGQTLPSTDGAANTGAGGGGSAGGATRTSGGSGIVLIRYPAAS